MKYKVTITTKDGSDHIEYFDSLDEAIGFKWNLNRDAVIGYKIEEVK